jgi:hypothetical protein
MRADRSMMNVDNVKDDRAKLPPATCHLIIITKHFTPVMFSPRPFSPLAAAPPFRRPPLDLTLDLGGCGAVLAPDVGAGSRGPPSSRRLQASSSTHVDGRGRDRSSSMASPATPPPVDSAPPSSSPAAAPPPADTPCSPSAGRNDATLPSTVGSPSSPPIANLSAAGALSATLPPYVPLLRGTLPILPVGARWLWARFFPRHMVVALPLRRPPWARDLLLPAATRACGCLGAPPHGGRSASLYCR